MMKIYQDPYSSRLVAIHYAYLHHNLFGEKVLSMCTNNDKVHLKQTAHNISPIYIKGTFCLQKFLSRHSWRCILFIYFSLFMRMEFFFCNLTLLITENWSGSWPSNLLICCNSLSCIIVYIKSMYVYFDDKQIFWLKFFSPSNLDILKMNLNFRHLGMQGFWC